LVVCVKKPIPVDLGILDVSADGGLLTYTEKPTYAFLVSSGMNVIRGSVVTAKEPDRIDMPDLLGAIQARGGKVQCLDPKCTWFDLGRLEDFPAANIPLSGEYSRVRVLVVGRAWLGRPAIECLGAVPFPNADNSTDWPADAPAGRLRDAIRPDKRTVMGNLSELRHGTRDHRYRSNAHIPLSRASSLAGSGPHLVHVGSAAECGVLADSSPPSEDSICSTTSDCGATMLIGIKAVLGAMPTETVVRKFNVVDADPPHGSPMSDIGERICRAIASQTPVEVLAASTIRDNVSRQFVIELISAASLLRPAGVFNVCSGVGVSTGDIARMVLDNRQMANAITSSDDSQSSTIVGDPTRWRVITGLAEELGWSESIG